jgi:hypothetical protein
MTPYAIFGEEIYLPNKRGDNTNIGGKSLTNFIKQTSIKKL